MDEVKIQFDRVGAKAMGERGRVVVDANPVCGIKHTVVAFENWEELTAAIERALRESGLRKEGLRSGV